MKRFSIIFLIISMAGLLITGCGNNNTASTDTNKDSAVTFDVTVIKKIIEEKNDQFTKAHITGQKDSVVMVNYFTQDAKIFPPNSDAMIGQPAIAMLTSQYMKFEISEFREETTAFYGNQDYLIDEGNYFMIYGEDNIMEKGKYLNVWKKEDGDWKVYSNIWNTNMPATTTGKI